MGYKNQPCGLPPATNDADDVVVVDDDGGDDDDEVDVDDVAKSKGGIGALAVTGLLA